jgi:hypothetical protein
MGARQSGELALKDAVPVPRKAEVLAHDAVAICATDPKSSTRVRRR